MYLLISETNVGRCCHHSFPLASDVSKKYCQLNEFKNPLYSINTQKSGNKSRKMQLHKEFDPLCSSQNDMKQMGNCMSKIDWAN